ncbi:MAG TPA: SagB/ThcOx family dehydrogenase, partial [Nitrospira sp.]|nr:SagB/ThcOx family dehydrogenase [Nitrospira sp.]
MEVNRSTEERTDPVDQIIQYHLQTKHHFNRYARALGYLDWANQPDPFRRYLGARLTALPLLSPEHVPVSPSYSAIFEREAVSPHPVTLGSLSRFFEFALALSAWKRAGESEWALRSNPSSGNLHPTEGYVVLPSLEGLNGPSGLYHYAPKEHALELRAEASAEALAALLRRFPAHTFLLGLTSVHWREAWKYGERAFRYCHHDVGHAIGTARIAASTLGWQAVLLDGCDHNTVATLLGTDRAEDFMDGEPEHPDCLLAIWPRVQNSGHPPVPLFLDPTTVKQVVKTTWFGKANRLSQEHGVHWDIIDTAAESTWKTKADEVTIELEGAKHSRGGSAPDGQVSAGQMIRQRRSAVAFDAATSISAATFFHMLHRVMPRVELAQSVRPMPWDCWPYEPAVHLMLFVHRIDGLAPGLYFLVRDPTKVAFLQAAMNAELTWQLVPGCPEDL